MKPFDAIALFTDFMAVGETLWNLLMIGILSLLIVEILKRLEDDFPNRKNFRLAHKERPFLKRELSGEVAIAIFNVVITAPLLAFFVFYVTDYVLKPYVGHHLFSTTIADWPMIVQVIVGLVILDFSLYVRHRFVHHFFWSYHTIHHSTREITWITWLKLHPLDMIVMGLIDVVIMFALGFGGESIAIAQTIKFHFNRFCHSNVELDYGFPLRYVFCSPNMHRWHHAADDPKAQNKNFCIVFAWIDLLFGTFYVPKDRLPSVYGVLDENGDHVVSEGFVDMMLYPFRNMFSRVQSHERSESPEHSDPTQ